MLSTSRIPFSSIPPVMYPVRLGLPSLRCGGAPRRPAAIAIQTPDLATPDIGCFAVRQQFTAAFTLIGIGISSSGVPEANGRPYRIIAHGVCPFCCIRLINCWRSVSDRLFMAFAIASIAPVFAPTAPHFALALSETGGLSRLFEDSSCPVSPNKSMLDYQYFR